MPRKDTSNVRQFRPRAKKAAKPPVTFSLAPEVERIANKIIGYVEGKTPVLPGLVNRPEKGSWLSGMSRLRDAKILFIFTSAEAVGRDKLATASKFAKKHLPIAEEDFAFEVCVSKPSFAALTEEQQYAMTYHELLHCGVSDKEKWTIMPHDLEEFASVVRHFGLWSERTKVMAEQMRLFDKIAAVRVAAAKK